MVILDGKMAKFRIRSPSNWMTLFSAKWGQDIYTRTLDFGNDNVTEVSVFMGEHDIPKVSRMLKHFPQCKVNHTAKSTDGVVAAIECKPSNFDRTIREIVTKTNSRVWINTRVDNTTDIIVENPWDINIQQIVTKIIQDKGLMLKSAATVDKPMQVPVPSSKVSEIDEEDIRVGKTLLIRGYLNSPRPPGLTQEALCTELNISKPTLEKHMRKIESIGIANLLGVQEFTKEEIDLSWKALKTGIKPREAR